MSVENTDFAVDYDTFKDLINYYGKRLKYDDGISDMNLFFVELCDNIYSDKYGAFSSFAKHKYICVALRNEFYRLSKAQNIYINKCADLYENMIIKDDNTFQKLAIMQAIETLTHKQKTAIILRYFMGFSESSIAEHFNISRQALNRLEKRALDKLKLSM